MNEKDKALRPAPDAAPVDGMVRSVPLGLWDMHTGRWSHNPLLTMSADEQYVHNTRNGYIATAPTREAAPIAQGEQGGHVDAVSWALNLSRDWIENAPHGDDCFVSDHYEGDPGNRCNCGKDGALQLLDDADEAMRIQQLAAPSPAEPVAVIEGVACPICDGTGRVDSVSKCCGPPRHLDEPQLCNRPPQGWYCGLARGHEGSCPAWPVSHETAALTATKAAQPESSEVIVASPSSQKPRWFFVADWNGKHYVTRDEIGPFKPAESAAPGAVEVLAAEWRKRAAGILKAMPPFDDDDDDERAADYCLVGVLLGCANELTAADAKPDAGGEG